MINFTARHDSLPFSSLNWQWQVVMASITSAWTDADRHVGNDSMYMYVDKARPVKLQQSWSSYSSPTADLARCQATAVPLLT